MISISLPSGRGAAEDKAGLFKGVAIVIVEFVAVAVPLVDDKGAVKPVGLAADDQLAGLAAQPHRAALAGDVLLFVQQGDDGMRGALDRIRWSARPRV